MVSRNSIKKYMSGGFYHLYNRGVAKNDVFLDDQDYKVFLHCLKEYLSQPTEPTEDEIRLMKYTYLRKNYHNKIELLSFCLMPNHFHLLIKQNDPRSIEYFMRSLLIRYSSYFNKRYNRVGHLFQDVYKGILIERESYFLWVSRYIHRNPLDLLKTNEQLCSYPYSSYPTYLGKLEIDWIKTEYILGNTKDYRNFVEGSDKKPPLGIDKYTLEY